MCILVQILVIVITIKMEFTESYPTTSATIFDSTRKIFHGRPDNPHINKSLPDVNKHEKTTPVPLMECFSGIIMGSHQQYSSGSWLLCEGYCTNITMNINYEPVTFYNCDPFEFCENIGDISDGCTYIFDGQMTMCCCNESDLCNIKPKLIPSNYNESILDPNPNPVNVSCFVGFALEQSVNLTDGTELPPNYPIGMFTGCYGECMNVTIDNIGTLYACDPLSVCHEFKATNTCMTIDHLVRGCCCSTDWCNIDLDHLPSTTKPDNLQLTTILNKQHPPNSIQMIKENFLSLLMCFCILCLRNFFE